MTVILLRNLGLRNLPKFLDGNRGKGRALNMINLIFSRAVTVSVLSLRVTQAVDQLISPNALGKCGLTN